MLRNIFSLFTTNKKPPTLKLVDQLDHALEAKRSEQEINSIVEQILLKSDSIDEKQEDGDSALSLLVRHKYHEHAKRLVNAKADVNSRDIYGYTPLMAAAGVCTKSLITLIDAKADIHAVTDDTGLTPLYIAALNNQIEILEILISKNAELDHQSKEGTTALGIALDSGHIAAVKLLIKHGVNVNLGEDNFYSPLDSAIYFAEHNEYDFILALIAGGADLFNYYGRTYLHNLNNFIYYIQKNDQHDPNVLLAYQNVLAYQSKCNDKQKLPQWKFCIINKRIEALTEKFTYKDRKNEIELFFLGKRKNNNEEKEIPPVFYLPKVLVNIVDDYLKPADIVTSTKMRK